MIRHFTEDGRRVYTVGEAAILTGKQGPTIRQRLHRAGIEPVGYINPREPVYHPEHLGIKEDTMATLELTQTAAAVISRARANSGLTAPEFDYDIATHFDQSVNGIGGPLSPLGNATHEIAREQGIDPDTLWADLQDELSTYARRCRDRKYSGWSSAARSRGQRIAYAD